MNLSDGEKLIIALLCDIHKATVKRGEVNVDLVMDALYRGHLWGLKWELTGVFDSEEPSEEVVDEVCNILDMWHNIEHSHSILDAHQKKKIEDEARPFGKDVIFKGFDGNHETTHMSVADFLIKKLGRFQEFSNHNLNSHAPALEAYRRMYSEYRSFNPDNSAFPLSPEQIIRLLREIKHPSNR